MTTRPKRDDFRTLVHAPTELASDYLEWAEYIQSVEGVTWGIEAIDKRVIPLRPGEMGVIIGRPGHGKTSILAYLARQEAQRIMARETRNSECVVFVTWEESAEELTKMFLGRPDTPYTITDLAWGRVDLDVVRRQAVRQSEFPPIFVIGHGVVRARHGKRAPRMTPVEVLGAIETLEPDFGLKPTLMLFDYVQRIPIANISKKTEEVTEATAQIGNLAMRIACPVYVGAQANRDVDYRDDKMPKAADCQWASAIEQDADKLFSLMRPIKYRNENELLELSDGRSFIIKDTLLMVQMLKQRGDAGNFTWGMYFDTATLKMGVAQTAGEQHDIRF